jgi:hypothetical protein
MKRVADAERAVIGRIALAQWFCVKPAVIEDIAEPVPAMTEQWRPRTGARLSA